MKALAIIYTTIWSFMTIIGISAIGVLYFNLHPAIVSVIDILLIPFNAYGIYYFLNMAKGIRQYDQ